MQITRIALLAVVVVACKGKGSDSGSGTEYKHDSPKFKLSIPSGLDKGKVHPEGDGGNLSFMSKDSSREVFLTWSPSGSPLDPEGNYATYGHEPDNTKIVAEGKLPGGAGKWIENERGPRTFIHAVMSNGGTGVLCMASAPTSKPDRALFDACKTLAPY